MINKRNEQTMMHVILNMAENDERIRAVIMNGSRANPNAQKDSFQDYDIIYLVKDVESFVLDRQWIKQLGDVLIMQTPDEMDGHWPKSKDQFVYLLQFKDGNRIDLTLLQQDIFASRPTDSQTILLLDKDQSLPTFAPASDKDYLPKRPTKKEFEDCCNEFLWVSLYVVKGVGRKQLTYAKHVAEHIVKESLIKLLIWYAGIKTHYEKSMGSYGKYLQQYLEPEIWSRFCQTYVDADYNHIWQGLFVMCDLFNELALKISNHCGYNYNKNEYSAVVAYLHASKKDIEE